MKSIAIKIAITIFIVNAFFSISFAQGDSTTAKIYFIGDPKASSLRSYQLLVDSRYSCSLNGKYYVVYNVPAGIHFLKIIANTKSKEMAIKVEKGKAYYLQFYQQSITTIVMKLIPEDLANMILSSLKEDKSCTENTNNN